MKDLSDIKWWRWKELFLTTLLLWVPLSPGRALRRIVYRTILARIGNCVKIESQVEFTNARTIEIGDGVIIDRGVCLRSNGWNSKICLKAFVKLDIGVIIKTHFDGDITIDERTYIGPYTCLSGNYIKIGKYCLIASHSSIYANNHDFTDHKINIREQGSTYKGIVIEDDCWLGSGVRVVDGVTIGQGSVIGAGAVVTKNIPPYSVAVGVPARVLKSRRADELTNAAKQKSYLPIDLITALTDVEEAVKLIYAKKAEELSHLSSQLVAQDNVLAHLSLQNLLQQLLDCVRRVMHVDTVTVLLPTEEGQQLTVRATLGLEEEIKQEIKIPFGRGFAGCIAASCELMSVDDLSKVEVVSPILRNKGLRSMLGVPLLVTDGVIGVFHVGTLRSRQFTREEAQLLQLVASCIGSTINQLASSTLALEKFASAYSHQQLWQTIINFHFSLFKTSLLNLVFQRECGFVN